MNAKIFALAVCLALTALAPSFREPMPAHAQQEEWKERKGSHFIIYYKNAPADFIKSVEEMAEYYYEEITRNMGFTRYKNWSWDGRAKIYIYDDPDDFQQVGDYAKWSEGVASSRERVIRSFPAAHGFFDSTLPHELGHIIFREFTGFKAKIPLWLEEGVAMYQEKARRWGAHEAVRQALKDGTFMPLGDMTALELSGRMDIPTIQLFYAESASIVNYLLDELGQQRFINLCRKLRDGGPFEWAFTSVYVRFKDIDALNKAWVDYLQK